MIVRRKTFALDGASVTVAALTMDQARAAFAEGKTSTRADIVALCLNNARVNGEPEWSTARIQQEMDPIFFQRLYDEIIDFCGLKPEETEPGEPAAPSQT